MKTIALVDLINGGTFGHRCLSASLKKSGFKVVNIFGNNYFPLDQRITQEQMRSYRDILDRIKPDVIGISMLTVISHRDLMELARITRETSSAPILAGGPYPSASWEILLREKNIDHICVGEGEESTVELCKRLTSGQAPYGIEGILSKEDLRKARFRIISNLDSLPYQEFGMADVYYIERGGKVDQSDHALRRKIYTTRASRGCVFNCSYCCNESFREASGSQNYYRVRSVDHTIGEIEDNIKKMRDVKAVYFSDDNFPSDKNWLMDFKDQYKSKVNKPFSIMVNPNSVEEDTVRILKDAGLYVAKIGVQSARDSIRNNIYRRGESEKKILACDARLSKYGIVKSYDFIVDNPWGGKDEIKDIFTLLSKCQKPVDRVNMHSLVVLPGTMLERMAVEQGYVSSEDNFANITKDPLLTASKMLWLRGMPEESSEEDSYWMALVYSFESNKILHKVLTPMLSSTALSGSRIFRSLFLKTAGKYFLKRASQGVSLAEVV